MNHRGETFTIEQSRLSDRLDVFLRGRYPAVSRGSIQRLIEQGHIRVNDHLVKPTHSPRAGEVVSIFWPEAQPAEAQPQAISLDILFEDKDLLVLNKPPGIVVHPAAGHESLTIATLSVPFAVIISRIISTGRWYPSEMISPERALWLSSAPMPIISVPSHPSGRGFLSGQSIALFA